MGGVLNKSIVIAAAKGIVKHLDPSRLHEHSGSIVLDQSWARSFFRRIDFVKRREQKQLEKCHLILM